MDVWNRGRSAQAAGSMRVRARSSGNRRKSRGRVNTRRPWPSRRKMEPKSQKRSFQIMVAEVNQLPVVTPIPAQKVAAGQTVRLAVKAKDPDKPAQTLSYRVKQGPPGLQVDGTSGIVTWTAPESGTELEHPVEIIVADAPSGGGESSVAFKIEIKGQQSSHRLGFMAALKNGGLSTEKTAGEAPAGFTGKCSCFRIEDDILTVMEYESDPSAADELAGITDGGKMLFGEPRRLGRRR